MDDKMMKIGEMARFNRVSITALRLYDKVGILRPCYTDPETNYRYYSIHQKARLDMIQYMKELGMSLGEIREILEKNICEERMTCAMKEINASAVYLYTLWVEPYLPADPLSPYRILRDAVGTDCIPDFKERRGKE